MSRSPSVSSRPLRLQDYVAVVSDFDDTILNNENVKEGGLRLHEASRAEALHEISLKLNIDLSNITPAKHTAAMGNAPIYTCEGASWWLLSEVGVFTKDDQFDPLHPIIQQLTELKDRRYRQLLISDAREIPGAHSFFQTLYDNGYDGKLAIASSGCREDILMFLGAHNFGHIFKEENIVTREDVTRVKPHPEPYIRAIESLGISLTEAHKILVFEDDPGGIIAAKAAGLTVCALTSRFSREDLLGLPVPPDFVADDFNQYAAMFGLETISPVATLAMAQ
jgi:HAD superfamily hydrolase (TIGR01509 family)